MNKKETATRRNVLVKILYFFKTSQRFWWILGCVIISFLLPVFSIIEHMVFGEHRHNHGTFGESIFQQVVEILGEYLDPNFYSMSFFNRILILFAPLLLLPIGIILGELFIRTKKLLASIEQSRSNLSQYSVQLENITENVQEGICIINSEYLIQSGVNSRFKEVFDKKDIVGRSIFDEIFLYLNEEDKIGLQRFFALCFTRKDISQTTLNKACPITKFWYNTLDIKSNKIKEQTISFQVLPIRSSEKEVTQLLLLFKDITYEELVAQEKELFITADHEVEFLQQMVKLDLQKITQYWNNFTFISNKIFSQATLLSQDRADSAIELLQDIAGAVHSLKGESLAANQVLLAEHCKKIEPLLKSIIANEIPYDFEEQLQVINWVSELQAFKNNLQAIVEKFNLEGGRETDSKNISASVNVEEIQIASATKDLESVIEQEALPKNIQAKLRSVSKILQDSLQYDLYSFEQELHTMLHAIMEQQKISNVSLLFQSTINYIPKVLYQNLYEIFIHLIRNFFAHGYETEEIRVLQNKYRKVELSVTCKADDANYIIQYKEEGKGFDLDKIAQKALDLQLVNETWIGNASEQDIISLVFQTAFSTKEDIADNAGAGQGMYVVQKNITDLQGTIKIRNTKGQGYIMLMFLPKLNV